MSHDHFHGSPQQHPSWHSLGPGSAAFTCYFHCSIISYHFIHSLLMTHFTSNYYYTLKIACLGCIFACSYSLSHTLSFATITLVGRSNGVNTEHMKHLNPRKSLLIKELWVEIYSNQKAINYISPSNIRASVETGPPKLPNLPQFSPPSIPDILWASP